jgi:hypothetical protein
MRWVITGNRPASLANPRVITKDRMVVRDIVGYANLPGWAADTPQSTWTQEREAGGVGGSQPASLQ